MSGPVERARPRAVPERVRWHDDALLCHGDLAAAVAHEERLLALHVSALHDTWGVALGLTLAASDDRRRVLVGPGVAYTALGEALWIGVAVEAPPFPAEAARADLVVALPRAGVASPCERLVRCDGLPVRDAEVSLRWETVALASDPASAFARGLADGVRLGHDVPLGSFTRRADGTLDGPDNAERRVARSLSRPHVALGTIPSGALDWHQTGDGLVASVDTSAHGFSTAPRYAAWLASGFTWPADVVGPFVSIAQATRTSFAARLVFGGRAGAGVQPGVFLEGAVMSSLVWLGVESTSGCPPVVTLPGLNAASWSAALGLLQLAQPSPGSGG